MLVLQRLPIERQRNVGAALGDIFKGKTTYKADITANAKAVIGATKALKAPEGASMFVIDRATDSVITAIRRVIEAWEKGLPDSVVPLDAEQQESVAAAALLDAAWFPYGIGFIHDAVGLQCDALLEIRKTLNDPKQAPEVQRAIKTLGLGQLVKHLSSHTTLYARALGLTADGDTPTAEEGASQAWHNAYVLFAASVMVHYADDAEARKALLGSYERQLQEHRAGAQKERRRQRAKKQKDDKEPPNDG